MARNFAGKENQQYDFKQLQSQLVGSNLGKTNPKLYQVVKRLITGAADSQAGVKASIKDSDLIDLESQVQGLLPPINGGVANGSYFPIFTSLANIATFSVYYTFFSVATRLVYVSGKLNIKATAANVLTIAELQMPIHSNFDSADQLQGVINGIPLDGSTEGFAGIVEGNVSNGQGRISYFPQNTDNHDIRFLISYGLF